MEPKTSLMKELETVKFKEAFVMYYKACRSKYLELYPNQADEIPEEADESILDIYITNKMKKVFRKSENYCMKSSTVHKFYNLITSLLVDGSIDEEDQGQLDTFIDGSMLHISKKLNLLMTSYKYRKPFMDLINERLRDKNVNTDIKAKIITYPVVEIADLIESWEDDKTINIYSEDNILPEIETDRPLLDFVTQMPLWLRDETTMVLKDKDDKFQEEVKTELIKMLRGDKEPLGHITKKKFTKDLNVILLAAGLVHRYYTLFTENRDFDVFGVYKDRTDEEILKCRENMRAIDQTVERIVEIINKSKVTPGYYVNNEGQAVFYTRVTFYDDKFIDKLTLIGLLSEMKRYIDNDIPLENKFSHESLIREHSESYKEIGKKIIDEVQKENVQKIHVRDLVRYDDIVNIIFDGETITNSVVDDLLTRFHESLNVSNDGYLINNATVSYIPFHLLNLIVGCVSLKYFYGITGDNEYYWSLKSFLKEIELLTLRTKNLISPETISKNRFEMFLLESDALDDQEY